MSHYEERLEADLHTIRAHVREVADRVEKALERAVHALLAGDRHIAYETILGDLPINRAVRELDRECHSFVARHLPSAGHLRFVSSVLRLNLELERIGDYAVSICREAVQLSSDPPATVARDIELMADQSRRALEQALRAWHDSNAELARGTIGMASQTASTFDKVLADLLREGQKGSCPVRDLFALLGVFNRLARVADQAKNICEETVFAVTGETKAPKVYRVLFVDAGDDCYTQLALAYARKAFPESGRYASAGWEPADTVEPRCLVFMDRHGLDTSKLEPRRLQPTHEELARYHVIVSLAGDLRPHVPEVPYQTAVLEWEAGPDLRGVDQERAQEMLSGAFKRLAGEVRRLMETLRGEGAS